MSETEAQVLDPAAISGPAEQVEAYIADFLKSRSMPSNLAEAVSYAVLGPGKRLRPVLAIRSCEAVGGKATAALPAAGAVEMVHAFSLVHDDLPAMDDDDMRRGRPTLHKHAGEAMAILAGDALLGLAFELLTCRVTEPTLCCSMVRELAVGTNDMVGGQVLDTLPQPNDGLDDYDRLEQIHKHKTGALLRAACRLGGLAGGADAKRLQALTGYADAAGLMFQVVDDLLDVTGTTEELGKTANKDEAQGKLTYPALRGIEESRAEVERLRAEALDALEPLGGEAEPLRALCEYMAVRQR